MPKIQNSPDKPEVEMSRSFIRCEVGWSYELDEGGGILNASDLKVPHWPDMSHQTSFTDTYCLSIHNLQDL